MNSTAAPVLAQRADDARRAARPRCPESAAVGSSMIRTRASKDSALAISTICWSAIDRPRAGRSGSSRDAEAVEQALDLVAASRARSIRPSAPQRLAAHEDVLGDREVGEERRLLVDDGDAGVARVGGAVEVDRLAVDQHVAGVGPVDAGQQLHERRLAGAVLADQRVHLAARAARASPSRSARTAP